MSQSREGPVTLKQTGLIKRLLSAIDTQYFNHNFIPKDEVPSIKDEYGYPCREALE